MANLGRERTIRINQSRKRYFLSNKCWMAYSVCVGSCRKEIGSRIANRFGWQTVVPYSADTQSVRVRIEFELDSD